MKKVSAFPIKKINRESIHPILFIEGARKYFNKVIIFKNEEEASFYRNSKVEFEEIKEVWGSAGKSQLKAKECRYKILKIFGYIEQEEKRIADEPREIAIKEITVFLKEKFGRQRNLNQEIERIEAFSTRNQDQQRRLRNLVKDLQDV